MFECWEEIKNNKELKPCPFCGERPILQKLSTKTVYRVTCDNDENCGVFCYTDEKGSQQIAIDAWNDRINKE